MLNDQRNERRALGSASSQIGRNLATKVLCDLRTGQAELKPPVLRENTIYLLPMMLHFLGKFCFCFFFFFLFPPTPRILGASCTINSENLPGEMHTFLTGAGLPSSHPAAMALLGGHPAAFSKEVAAAKEDGGFTDEFLHSGIITTRYGLWGSLRTSEFLR